MAFPVKICGLRDAGAVSAAVDAGARYLGFNFYPKTPRFVEPQVAGELSNLVPAGVCKVGLFVDSTDDEIASVLALTPLDMIQLHGSETSQRVADVRARFGLPVMRAIGIGSEADVPRIAEFGAVADQLLIDAKPANGLPGGTGITFDWRLIENRRWPVPWMLAGGLTADNVAEAIAKTGAAQVDVSSGVEAERGVKDHQLIRDFVAAAARQDEKA